MLINITKMFMQTFKTIIFVSLCYYSNFVTHNVVHFIELKFGYWTEGRDGVNMVNITEIQLFFYLEIISANFSPGEKLQHCIW